MFRSFFTFLAIFVATSTFYSSRNKKNPVFKAFSLASNFQSLMDTRSSDDEISCLNGLRVIFIMTVVYIHRADTLIWLCSKFNVRDMYEVFYTMLPVTLDLGDLSVDGFILISGIVLAYNFFRKRLKNIEFNVIKFYMERYFRLTPMLACVILYYSTLLIHQGQGPIWYTMVEEEEQCNKNWWAGLLHVTNYIDPKCVEQSYYVALDFQFYLLSPLFLLPLHRKPKIGFLLLATASLVSSLAATVNSYVKHIGTGNIIRYVTDRNTVLNDGSNYYGIHYRVPSFCMGLALGYFLFQVKIKKHDFIPSKRFWWLGWTTSVLMLIGFVLVTAIVCDPNHKFSPWLDPLYLGFQRPVYCAAVGWIIFACSLGHGGLVNRFLSWTVFRPLGKLTYCVFLIHIIFVYGQVYSIQDPVVYSFIDMLYLLNGDLMISSALAFVCYLTVEAPCSRLASYLLSGKSTK
ncbi:nose resistant to fluoxetine protein 6-like [Homalodisca vitripennis]|uniref:nose resistant to fluoxetine protein 6-like n=1 Tax=Homalodisca vitripennis TaxID=197043 RepID=UPI001EEBE3AB|nr:nose resistant to fluoxetine protein 6-like [Homalodisca vitripennis]